VNAEEPSRGRDWRSGGGRLRAVHVVAGLDVAHGGPSYSVPRLCEALAAASMETTLLAVAGADGGERDTSDTGYRERRFAWDYARLPLLRGLRRSSGLSAALHRAAGSAGVIHSHGLWLMPNVEAGRAAARARTPLVVSPRGMLAPAALAFSPLKKRAFWHLLQGPAISAAACLHATSEEEYGEIRDFGLAQPVAIIPNGIDLPAPDGEAAAAAGAGRTVLSLGRIHPKKNQGALLRAWAELEPGHPAWRLRIVGPGEAGHDGELRALAARLGLTRVSIEAPVYGDAKFAIYRTADVFVLPTLNENFGLTVAEALASGTPVISTKGAPWRGLATEGCGWWIEHGEGPLATALARAMAMPRDALKAMGAKGRLWMERDFSWDRVAGDTVALYRWLAGAADMPATVRLT
jgi:glycosyltransferase involved in cell wall biosynthesis